MKKTLFKILAIMAEKAISQANNSASRYWSYQPKVPKGIKNFKK